MDLVIAPGTSGAHSKFRSDSASALPADEHVYSSSVAMDVRLAGGLNPYRGTVDQRSADRPGSGAVAVWIRPFGGWLENDLSARKWLHSQRNL